MVHFLKNKMLLLTRRKVDTFILNLISFSVIILFSFQNTFASKIIQSGFIENKGQIVDQNFLPNNNVLFLFAGKGTNIQLRKTGYSFEVFNIENSPEIITGKIPDIDQLKKLTDTKIQLHRVDIEFNGMNPNTKIITEQGSTYCFNYFTNGRDISNVHYFTKVIYKELYPQIDMEFITDGDTSVKYNIILHAGADINKIKLLVFGTEKTELQNTLFCISNVLGFDLKNKALINKKLNNSFSKLIDTLVLWRSECKIKKDYSAADKIRDILNDSGVELKDASDNLTKWQTKL